MEESSDEDAITASERPPTPDGCSKGFTIPDNFSGGKWELICEALHSLMNSYTTEIEELYVWMDVCCVASDTMLAESAESDASSDEEEPLARLETQSLSNRNHQSAAAVTTSTSGESVANEISNKFQQYKEKQLQKEKLKEHKKQRSKDRDPNRSLGKQLNQQSMQQWGLIMFDRIMRYMDCMLTVVLDDSYVAKPWALTNSGYGLHQDYKASGWHRFLSRRWCRLEMAYCANVPLLPEKSYYEQAVFDRKLNPLVGKAVVRADRLCGGLQYERLQARRPHLLYGTRERVLQLPPLILPHLSAEAVKRLYNPAEGQYSRPSDAPILERLNRELWPYTRKGEAGYEGERDNWGTVGQPGRRHGRGTMAFPNGNYYEGEWHHGDMQGKGVYKGNNGDNIKMDIYIGRFTRNLQDGESAGEYVRHDGASYRGDWKMGKRHGIGLFTWPDGSQYRGYWQDDERHGRGDLTLVSGAKFSGMWSCGKRCGHGIMRWPDGSYYDGDWKNDKRHGYGIYRTPYARGHMYCGEWEDGMKQGRGKMVIGGAERMCGPGTLLDMAIYEKDPQCEVLDGWFQAGNFVQEYQVVEEKTRLERHAASVFEIDSDEERRLESEAFQDTQLRFQRERDMGIVAKPNPALLEQATRKLAEAAKRRKAQNSQTREQKSGHPVEQDMILHLDSSNTSSKNQTVQQIGADCASVLPSVPALVSRKDAIVLPNAEPVSMQTPRSLLPQALQQGWQAIDELEEQYIEFLSKRSVEPQDLFTTTRAFAQRRWQQQRVLLSQIANRYHVLAVAYDEHALKADATTMREHAAELLTTCKEIAENSDRGEVGVNTSRQTIEIKDAGAAGSETASLPSWITPALPTSASSSRRNSRQMTPRAISTVAISQKWAEIDTIENNPEKCLINPSDYFLLARHYVALSDLYLHHEPQPNFGEAIEARTHAYTCLVETSAKFDRNFYSIGRGSANEKNFVLSIVSDLQRIRDLAAAATVGAELSVKATPNFAFVTSERLAVREEIRRIMHQPSSVNNYKESSQHAAALQKKDIPRDKNGYPVHYPHDYDTYF